jgi:sugar-specific transcriptional regulator TrmB
MSLEHVLDTLVNYGLRRTDARVYVYLAMQGSHRARDLSHAINLRKHQLYFCLKCLRNRGFVTASHERPALFSAVPLEEALNLLLKTKMDEAQRTQRDMDVAISEWQSINQGESES